MNPQLDGCIRQLQDLIVSLESAHAQLDRKQFVKHSTELAALVLGNAECLMTALEESANA